MAGASEKKVTLEMLGEFLREVAVLVLVFVPLDFFAHNLTAIRFIYAFVVSTILLVVGIAVERMRP